MIDVDLNGARGVRKKFQTTASEFEINYANMERNSYGQPQQNFQNPRQFSFWMKPHTHYLKVVGI
jgi:hypothetical protein